MTNIKHTDGLIEMIEAQKPGLKPADIARRSGGRITAQRLYSMLSRGRLKAFPDKDTIEGLAAGMGVRVAEVVLAAARSLDIDAKGSDLGGEDDLVIYGGAKLSPESQALIRQTAQVARMWEAGETSPADTEEAGPAVNWQSEVDLAAHEQREPTESERRDAALGDLGEESQDAEGVEG